MTHETKTTSISRRRLLKRGGVAAGVAALLGGVQLAGAQEMFTSEGARRNTLAATSGPSTLRLDVACDGNTLRINRAPGVEPDALTVRGDTFEVNGRIFPAGTIEAGLASPHQDGSIGAWVCRGWFYHGLAEIAEGAVPHLVTTQLYLLDSFDGLVTEGTEGGIPTVRAITGGYGKYAGVRGELYEEEVGSNDTMLDFGAGVVMPAFNFKMEFRLME